jgi:O-antigen ligase
MAWRRMCLCLRLKIRIAMAKGKDPSPTTRIQEWAAVTVAFLVPLAFWPTVPSPFSTAKEWLLAAWLLLAAIIEIASGSRRSNVIPMRALGAVAHWILAISLSAGTGTVVSLHAFLSELLPCAIFLMIFRIRPDEDKICAALAASGALVAAIALFQFAGWDPFGVFGWTGSLQTGSRIRIFSTLGNPNFVAAFLTAVLPITIFPLIREAGKKRRWLMPAALLQACGVIATGSRAPILGLLAAGSWMTIRGTRHAIRLVLPALAVGAALLLFSPARPLDKTIAGRTYIWRIIGKHSVEIPPAGFGPGAFVVRFAEWEVLNGTTEVRNPGSPSQYQDHAHNDYLEFLVDHGIVGLLCFVAAVLVLLAPAIRAKSDSNAIGAAASVVALLAVAAVDFPLHRPVELYIFWMQLALLSTSIGNFQRNAGPVIADAA